MKLFAKCDIICEDEASRVDLDLWRFGRKPVLFGAVALQGLSGLAQIFSPSWTVFVVLFFITGIGRVSSYVSGFILGKHKHLLYR